MSQFKKFAQAKKIENCFPVEKEIAVALRNSNLYAKEVTITVQAM